jgi:hypothetical protein
MKARRSMERRHKGNWRAKIISFVFARLSLVGRPIR